MSIVESFDSGEKEGNGKKYRYIRSPLFISSLYISLRMENLFFSI